MRISDWSSDVCSSDLVIIAALGYVVYRRQVLAIARIGEDFLKALRIRVFDHLQRLSMPFYDREKAGVVVSRMTSDIDALSELVQMGDRKSTRLNSSH